MTRIGKPRGLIDYATLDDCAAEKAGRAPRRLAKVLSRPRTLIYFAVWSGVGFAMLLSLGDRTRLTISAQHERNPSFVQLSDGHVRNGYTVKLRNMEGRPRTVEVSIAGLPGAVLWTEGGSRDRASDRLRTTVPADALAKLPIFVAAAGREEGSASFEFRATALTEDRPETAVVRAEFERPEQK
jgi:polyferredoxin